MVEAPEDDDWEAATIAVDWEAPTTVELVPTAIHLMEQLDKRVVGHSRAKEALVAAVRMHMLRSEGTPPRVLLMGPRGVGKTTLGEALSALTDLPSARIDFSEVAVNGGAEIPRLLAALAPHDVAYMPYGVLFLDSLESLVRPPRGAAPSIDLHQLQADLLRSIELVERRTAGPGFRYDRLLIFGAVAIEEPLKHTASQAELKSTLDAAVPLLPALAGLFDIIIPIDRLNAAQVARTFLLDHSAFARARRVIASLGGTFHCDPGSVEALARTCAVSPVGGWAANRVIDRLLEQVLRSPDPAKTWRLRDSQT